MDPSGEIIPLIFAGAVLIGGIINVASNWDNIDNFWEGAAAFVSGGTAGGLTAAFGPVGAVMGGLLVGGTNAIIAQTGNGVGLGDIDWKQVAFGSIVGGFTAAVSAGLSQYAGNHLGGVLINKLSISAQSAIGGAVTGLIGGVVSGYGAGLLGGMMMTKGDWSAAHKMAMNGLKTGAAIGLITGAVMGGLKAHENGNNFWTGKSLSPNLPANYYPPNDGALGDWTTETLQPGTRIDRYGDFNGKYFSPQDTPLIQRSLSPFTDTNLYNSFEVMQPFPVQKSFIAPAFGQPGGGIQYYSKYLNTYDLLNGGYLKSN